MNGSIFILLISVCSVKGAPDNRGTKFVIGFMENLGTSYNLEIFVTTGKSLPVSVSVSAPRWPSLQSQSFTVTVGNVRKVEVKNELRMTGSGKSTKGILITGSDEIVVHGVNKEQHTNDGFLAIPTDVLGMDYYLTGYWPSGLPSQLLVVGVEDGTSISIQFGENTGLNVTYSGVNYYKNDVFRMTIQAYDTLQIQTMGELTGTHVTSNKIISMYSGNVCTKVPTGYRDHLVEQHIPVKKWGKSFATVPIPGRSIGDFFRFVASEFNTEVTVNALNNGSPFSETFTLTKVGSWIQKDYSSNFYALITATKPIYVVQYSKSQPCASCTVADPAMIIIPPIEQYASDYVFTTPQGSNNQFDNYFYFVIKNSEKSGLRVNGASVNPTFNSFPGGEYVGGFLSIQEGTYEIRHTSPNVVFMGAIYGRAHSESYGFPVGLRLNNVNDPCTVSTMVVGDGIDNDCDGLVDEEMCTTANNYADDDSDGVSEEDCAKPYPIDGVWTSWESWGPCTCTNSGTRTRRRACDNPPAQYDGKVCPGADVETDTTCSPASGCRVNGNWALWGTWSGCTVTCGTGKQDRTRTCTDPAPSNGGTTCTGNTTQTQNCNTNLCPIDGGWTPWTSFSSCNYICGTGLSNRTRDCTNPAPQYGGKTCVGTSHESQSCTGSCAVDGNWNSWTSWGSCTKSCGTGIRVRGRDCNNPVPSNGGQSCVGDPSEFETCNTAPCPTQAAGVYVQRCPNGWFTCETGGITCVEIYMKCDCSADCDDGSDETASWGGCYANVTTCHNAAQDLATNYYQAILPLAVLYTLLNLMFM